MRYVKVAIGVLFMLASPAAFGAGCNLCGQSSLDWVSGLGSGSAASRFGQCVANVDRLFVRGPSLIALGLMFFFFLVGAMFLASARNKKKTGA